ncbi:hypothetical protein BU17DRAFT_71718 [Hysterangium stoloniferum]|nr:hypothetical protein BU17DRAFT_71718 [Hysterangium stoloniferum]
MDKEGGHSLKSRVILRPVPAPNNSARPVLRGLTPASPVQNPLPPNLQCRPVRSLPTGRCQKALFATGKAVVAVDWTCRSSGSNNPSVQSKVAPASDSRPEPSVE